MLTPGKVSGLSRSNSVRKLGIKRPSHWMARLVSVLTWTTGCGEYVGNVLEGNPVLQQVFSCNHELTRLWNATGEDSLPPIGMFDDPWVRRTVQVDRDLLNPLVQNRIREEAKSGPANLWCMSHPRGYVYTGAAAERRNSYLGTITWGRRWTARAIRSR